MHTYVYDICVYLYIHMYIVVHRFREQLLMKKRTIIELLEKFQLALP